MADLSWLTDMLPSLGQAGMSAIQAYLNRDASQDAGAAQTQGYQDALNALTGGSEQSRADLLAGYGSAFQTQAQGADEIMGWLLSGRDHLNKILTDASQAKDTGYQQTAESVADYLTEATGSAALEHTTGAKEVLAQLGLTEDKAMEMLNKQGFHARDALVQGYTKAFGDIDEGLTDALGLAKAGGYNFGGIKQLFDEYTGIASGKLDPYEQMGRQGLNYEAALIGALGNEAQESAFDRYMASPGQKYLRDKQEESLLRNQAAIGGLQGGRVRTALQEQAKDIASTNFQQDVSNLRNLAQRGQQAAATQGGFYQQSGANMGSLRAQLESEAMAQRTKVNLAKAQMAMQAANQKAALTGQGTETMSRTFRESGQDMASLLQNIGMLEADTVGGLSSRLAELELELGLGLGSITERLGDLQTTNINDLANNLANIDSTTLQNIINTVDQTTTNQSNLQTALGTALGNTGLENQGLIAALLSSQGSAEAAQIIGGNQAWQTALGDIGNIYGNIDWTSLLGGGGTDGSSDFDAHWSNYTPDVGGGI